MNNQEKVTASPERELHREALEQIAQERREQLNENHEKSVETSPERSTDDIRHEALEQAVSHERTSSDKRDEEPAAERRASTVRKSERDASYRKTMSEVQTHMSAPSRAFSKIIHNPAIEKISETAGATVARPNAVLAGALVAFIFTLAVYVVAKNSGYPLSGFETIAAFGAGWATGVAYDFLRVMITGRK